MNKKWFLLFPLLSSLIGCSNVNEGLIIRDDKQFSNNDSKIITSFDNEIIINEETVTFSNLKDNSGAKLVDSSLIINRKGKYKISGTSTSINIVVNDVDNTGNIYLVLDDVELINESKAPLVILNSEKTFVQSYENSHNILSYLGNGYAYNSYNIESAVYARDNIVLNGKGQLDIISSYTKGIDAKDYLKILGNGTINISAPSSQGLSVNDSLRIGGSLNLNISCLEDAIHLKNDKNKAYFYMEGGDVHITCGQDAIEVTSDDLSSPFLGYTKLVGGHLDIKTTNDEGKSAKGIKCLGNIYEGSIDIDIDSIDDGLHSDASIYITSGDVSIKCGSDALHANEAVYIYGGKLLINECFEGIEATYIYVKGGMTTIYALDDGLNAGKKNDNDVPRIEITGGYLDITVGNGDVDGIDSNGYYYQNGGLVITRGAPGNNRLASGLDVDLGASINMGTFICIGAIETMPTKGKGVYGISLDNTYIFDNQEWKIEELNISVTLSSSYYGFTIYSSSFNQGQELNISSSNTRYHFNAE